MKDEFDWGYDNPHLKEIHQEIFTNNVYEKVYSVKNGDVVLDIGASMGPFTWSVMDKASQVIALEPSLHCIPFLEKNTKGYNVFIEPKAIGKWDGNTSTANLSHFHTDGNMYVSGESIPTISLGSIIEKYKLDKIDFIKTDCEGGEYSLFTDENMPYLLNNVRNIVGEFHFSTDFPEQKVEFRYFRDKYLKLFKTVEVFSVDGVNIKWDLYNDHFIEYYNGVMIHLSNE